MYVQDIWYTLSVALRGDLKEAAAHCRDLYWRLARPADWRAAIRAVHDAVLAYRVESTHDLAVKAAWVIIQEGRKPLRAEFLRAAAEYSVDVGDIIL
ncbi:hypothetical protein EBZ39_01295 [bacterium]|nr:hypothetical protein [bacterium]